MITKKTTKTADEIKRQLERLFKLHFTYNCGTEKMWEKIDEIGYRFVSGLAY